MEVKINTLPPGFADWTSFAEDCQAKGYLKGGDGFSFVMTSKTWPRSLQADFIKPENRYIQHEVEYKFTIEHIRAEVEKERKSRK